MAMNTPRLVIIGGGNMGTAIVGGLVNGGWDASSITVVELDAAKRATLESDFGVTTSDVIVAGEGALIAVKPGDAASVCAQVSQLGTARVLSIAAAISVQTLQSAAGATTRVVRAMPNTPALVREGVTAICGSDACTEDDFAWAESVLSAVGVVVRVPESQMDAVTAVAGSGPGYVFLIAEALLDAARAQGLPDDVANVLVRQLFRGAGILLADSPESPATLRERVTSPNGTTAAGLAVLEDAGIRETMHNVVRAAAARSAEMGK
jgi:pyrroline-5-carboxylate reductase